jgi:hypothetical protein
MDNLWDTELKYDKQFEDGINQFIKFMKKQDKIVTARDMIPKMNYEYITAYKKIDRIECLLWEGVLINREVYDAQLNIGYEKFGTGRNQGQIYIHKKGTDLRTRENWVVEIKPYWKDTIKEMLKGE